MVVYFCSCVFRSWIVLMGLAELILVRCVFFFFKQKTAYEMRISDWSSDVCSSDLGARRAAEGFVAVREAAEAVDDVEMFLRIILEHRVVEPAEQPQRFAQIGRASCRERVCQYV